MSNGNQIPEVATVARLNLETLRALIAGDVLAIRVPDFYNPNWCQSIAEALMRSSLKGNYANADVLRVGRALFERSASPAAAADYDENATSMIETFRADCAPHPYPTDLLRLRFDEAWPGGCTLATFNGLRTFVGLARVFPNGAGTEKHQDVIHWDIDAPEALQATAQIACNVHVSTAQSGGQVSIWPCSLTRDEYQSFRNPGSYGVSEAAVAGLTPAVVAPERGDLVLFLSWNIHQVHDSFGDFPRIACSNFAMVEIHEALPIRVWS